MSKTTEERIIKLTLAVASLSIAVRDLAWLCDVHGNMFDEESARRFDSQWDMCQEMLAEALKGIDDD